MIKEYGWIVEHLIRYGNCSISRKRLIRGRDRELLDFLTSQGLACEVVSREYCKSKKNKVVNETYPVGHSYIIQVIK